MTKKLTKKSDEYIESLRARALNEPNNEEIQVDLGEACLLDNDVQGAIQAYNRAAELDPNSYFRSIVQEWLGYIYRKAYRITDSTTAYTRWAQIDTTSGRPLDRWRSVLVQNDMELSSLVPMYKRRLEVSPNDLELRTSLVLLYHALGFKVIKTENEEQNLLDLASSILEIDCDNLSMHYLLGQLYLDSALLGNAESEFKKVQELDKERTWCEWRFNLNWTFQEASFMLGFLARLNGDSHKAMAIFKSYLEERNETGPYFVQALDGIIAMHMERGEYDLALDFIEEQQKKYDSLLLLLPNLRRIYSRCLLGIGKIEEATDIYSQADPEKIIFDLEQSESSNISTTTPSKLNEDEQRASSAYERGDYSEAAQAYTSLLAQNPKECRYALRLSQAYAKQNKLTEAIKTLEEQLKDSSVAINALEEKRLDKSGLATKTENFDTYLEIWQSLRSYYKETGDTLKYRLADIQFLSLTSNEDESNVDNCELIAPAAPDSKFAAVGISAKSAPGNGRLHHNCPDDSKIDAILEPVWFYLKAETAKLDLPNLNGLDVYVHLRGLGRNPSVEFSNNLAETEPPLCNSDIGLAVLTALVDVLKNRKYSNHFCVVGGRLDLQGCIHSSPTLIKSLQHIYSTDLPVNALMLPKTVASSLELLPARILTVPHLLFCSDVNQALKLWAPNRESDNQSL